MRKDTVRQSAETLQGLQPAFNAANPFAIAGGGVGVGMSVAAGSSSSSSSSSAAAAAGRGAVSNSFLNMSVDAGNAGAGGAEGKPQKKFSELFPQAMNAVKMTPHVFSTTQRQNNSKKIRASAKPFGNLAG